MKKILISVIAIFILCGVVFTQNQSGKIDLSSDGLEVFSDYSMMCPENPFDVEENEEIDLRSCNLSKYDLSDLPEEDLARLNFDDKTIWPKKMPAWLDIKKINQIGKTPGLHLRDLHNQGITGKGVNMAIIDQALSPHQEYNENLVFYKNLDKLAKEGSMHGVAVASIAVGKNVGVAPGANLYYISANFSDFRDYSNKKAPFNANTYAESIEYLLELNKTLPKEEKISIIAMSRGFSSDDIGRERFLKVLEKAKKQNIIVFSTNNVCTVSREGFYANPDNISFYNVPAGWFDEEGFGFYSTTDRVCVPSDYRITSSPNGNSDYVAYYRGDYSWAVPYLAGIATLAKQVNPKITQKEFEEIARKTAQRVQVKGKSGNTYPVSKFINPQALIQEVKSRKNQRQYPSEKENLNNLQKSLESLQKNKK